MCPWILPSLSLVVVLLKGKLSEVHENFEEFRWASEVKVAQSCLTLCNPMDYTVNGLLQARILELVAIPFSRASSQPRDWTQVSHIAGGFFTSWATREACGKESACQNRRCKRHRFYPLVTKIPARGNGNPLCYSCLGNPTDRGACQAIVYGATE